MRVFADFDAVKAAVGEDIGVSDWVLVSQQRIDRFAEATGDDQWIHVDVERAHGSNRVRYLSPVPAGSRLRGRIGIAQAVDVPPNGLRVTYHTTVEIEGSERPACVADTIGVHFR